ncbi:hypothetical protein Hamer_G001907 [Homarus americanus]|uniref:Mutator-like transposase domain-containing protein n=1 Tax=Homarus americanus TaxID=6706 RepID=A0A8J5MQX8_HOMAM|nr:hypothetical protein Hamer_G001907 [Homarus americanus]
MWKTDNMKVNAPRTIKAHLGDMEAEGAKRMFGRSQDLKFRYENFVGDGDSGAYNAVITMGNGNGPYQSVQVKKLECINHVQKRMGTRLRKLRDEEMEIRTKTGVQNKLSDKAIDTLTSYYGNAVRSSAGKSFRHEDDSNERLPPSTDGHCQHGLSSEGSDSCCCFFQRGLAEGKGEEGMWTHALKTKFVGLHRAQFVAKTVILDHNYGYQDASLLKAMKKDSLALEKSLKDQDVIRQRHATLRARPKRKTMMKSTPGYARGAY